jgi:branched-subunit amino acid aminotransferase/4-amino-4-deoxychorismate lyase
MRLLKAVHENTTTVPVTLSQLIDVDAVFATNAAVGIRPVMAIDGLQFPAGHLGLEILGKRDAAIRPELL